MKNLSVWLLAGGLCAHAPLAGADPVIFLGHPAFVDGMPVHMAERTLRGSGTYDDPYYYEDEFGREGAYEPPVYQRERAGPLGPRQVAGMLRARGFHSVSDIERFRGIYGVSATDPEGVRVRLAVDAWTGEIRSARVMGPAYRDYDARYGRYDDRDYYREPAPARRRAIERRELRSPPPRSAAVGPPDTPSANPGRRDPNLGRTAALRPEIVTPPLPKARPKSGPAVAAVGSGGRRTGTTQNPTGSSASVPGAAPDKKKERAGAEQASATPGSKPSGAGTPVVKYRPPAAANQPPAEELKEPGDNPLVVY